MLFLSLAMISCKQEAKETANLETLSGEFLYIEEDNHTGPAAVINKGTEVYGVVINEKMKELQEKCNAFKKDKYDMIPVVVKGIIKPNPVENAWKEVVEIKEIVSVTAPSENQEKTIIVK